MTVEVFHKSIRRPNRVNFDRVLNRGNDGMVVFDTVVAYAVPFRQQHTRRAVVTPSRRLNVFEWEELMERLYDRERAHDT